jgi:hypothetical protein
MLGEKPLPTKPKSYRPLKSLKAILQRLHVILDHTNTATMTPHIVCVCLVLFETVSCSPGWPGTHSAKNGLRLVILALPPKCWASKHVCHPICFLCWGLCPGVGAGVHQACVLWLSYIPYLLSLLFCFVLFCFVLQMGLQDVFLP